MYKLLLCWRYLRTRYIALASIISVTLGVATMIVVNSVMEGFTSEMQNRIHGILSDVVFESHSLDGMPDAEWHMEQIRQVAGDEIEGMTPTVVVPAMLSYQCGGNWITQQVQLIGIDEQTQGSVSDFGKYLQHPANREADEFRAARGRLRRPRPPGRRRGARARRRWPMPAGSTAARWPRTQAVPARRMLEPTAADATSRDAAAAETAAGRRPIPSPAAPAAGEAAFDPAKEQHTGVVLGIAMASYRTAEGEDRFLRPARRRREADLPHRRHAARRPSATTSRSSISTKAR